MIPPSATDLATRLRAVINASGYDYLLSLPDDYAEDASRRWPSIVFLHGAGDRGADVWGVTRQGLPRLLAGAPDLTNAELAAAHEAGRRFITIAPQCPHFEVWDERTFLALLDGVGGTLKLDLSRVYLVGLSMGGFGAWSFGIRHPQRFAAIVPICGGGRLADVLEAERTHRHALRQLGVWAFHGARDSVVPLEESERMIAALKKAGVHDARLTVYPDCEHDAWSETFANRELYAWLLRHAR